MSTKFLSPGWRMPRNANQSKSANYSLDFDASQYIDTNYYLPAGTKPKSISYWFKNTDPNGWSTTGYNYTIHGGALSTGAGFGMGALGSSFGSYLWFIGHSTGDYFIPSSATGVMTTNVWYHIVVTYDNSRTNNLHFYLDGVKIDETNETLNTSTANSVKIGASATGGGNSGGRFMEITDVCFFDYALSESQVTTLWGGGTSVSNPMALPSPPIAYYPLGTSAWNGEYLAENNAIGDYVFDFIPNDYVAVAASTDFNFGTGDFTISTWVNIDASGSFPYLFDFRDSSGTGNNVITCYIDSSRISVYAGGAVVINGGSVGTALSTGIWYNIIIKRDNGTVTTHINGGSADASGTFTGDMSTTPKLNIGARYDGNNGLNGKFSNFQIFNTALSSTEITTLYNYGSPIRTLANIPQNSNLKAWYKLDATEIYNSTSTEWSVDNNQNPSAYPSSLYFDGNDYIDCGATVQQPTTNYSVSCWVKFTTIASAPTGIVGNFQGSIVPQRGYAITHQNGTPFQFWADGTASSNAARVQGITNPVANVWYNIVGTYDGANVKIYVNNVLENTVSYSATPATTNQNLKIGRWYGNIDDYYTNGSISNVSIWNAALTDGTGGTLNQIETLYNNGTPLADMSSFSSLVSWWKLNNTTTGIEDSKGSNNGTNSGATEYPGFVNKLAGDSTGMSQSNLVQSDLQTVAPYSKYALSFDGNDYIDFINGSTMARGQEITYSVWANLDIFGGDIIGNKVSSNFGTVLGFDAGDLIFQLGNSSNDSWYNSRITLSSYVNTGEWFHIIGTFDGTNAKIYINGIERNNWTPTQPFTISGWNNNFQIGKRADRGGGFINGRLSNVAFWNSGLTSPQVREIYNEGLPSDLHNFSGTAPVAWWQLGENSSFNGNDWIVADEIESNNGESDGMGVDALTNGVGTTANGTSTGMSEGNLVGDAPYSTANAISSGMPVTARGTDVPS